MKSYIISAALSFAALLPVFAEYPLTVFDFNFRGANPAQQIRGIQEMGFDGIAMPLKKTSALQKLATYRKAVPDLKLVAGLYLVDTSNPEKLNKAHLQKVLGKLAEMDAKLWLILGGEKGNPNIAKTLAEIADMAAAKKVKVSIYPHDNQAVETAEEALVYLKEVDRPNLTISVHQCHEMRGGNTDRLDEVMAAVGPYMDLVTICGSDQTVNDNSKDWSDAIKPLGEGDYDPKHFLRALKKAGFKGPIILHTFGLMKKPDSHFRNSLEVYQKMAAEVDAEPITSTTQVTTMNHQQEVMKKPLRVDMASDFPLPAAAVWKLIAGFDTLPDYHASITTSELSEGGVVRKIGLTEDAGGGYVVERLIYLNDESREFSYKITNLIDCDFPLRNYQAFVRVETLSEKSCRVHWGSCFTVEGATEEEGDELAKIIYQGCFDGIKRVLLEK